MRTELPNDLPMPQEGVACGFCDSTDTELFSLFGGLLLGSQYYCRSCHTVFEVVRWREAALEERDEEN
jgi:hypothetical protein